MKFSELSKEDQNLLNTDFGEEIEKKAAAEVAANLDVYNEAYGNYATQTADALDKLAEEAEKEEKGEKKEEGKDEKKEEKLEAEAEKTASERGRFFERGYFDGLSKLGQERHSDPMHYLYPFIEEKVVTAAAAQAAMGVAKAFGKGVKGEAKGMFNKAKKTWGDVKSSVVGKEGKKALAPEARAKRLGSAAMKAGVPAALVGGGVAAGRASKD